MRNVLIHYHIFKNGGSSLDAILRESLGARWISWDLERREAQAPRRLAELIKSVPEVIAISSHEIRPPLPIMKDVTVYPVFLVRHPILRVASVYKFARSHPEQSWAEKSFAEYVRWYLRPDVGPLIRDFQTLHLSGEQLRYDDVIAVATRRSLERAVAILEDAPVFGIVEQFKESVRRFARCYEQMFPEIAWRDRHENSTGTELGTAGKIREAIGARLYKRLEAANVLDLTLYDRACSLFESRSSLF